MEKQDMDGGDGHATESEKLISIQVEVPKSSLATSIRNMISEHTPLSQECCIFRVPVTLRQRHGPQAYEPLVVSLGPFHHGKEELKIMEKRKIAYLETFLARCSDISLETCIDMIKEWEQRIRNCYEETNELSSDEFVKMILLDSCFVIEIVWTFFTVNKTEEVTDRPSQMSNTVDVLNDMILLENQLPFFVLQALFDLTKITSTDFGRYYFTFLCIHYMGNDILSGYRQLAMEHIENQQPTEIKHLLDLLRTCQAPSITRQIPRKRLFENNSMWKATTLEEAGMVIKPRMNNYKSAVDICYTTGVLEIPKLNIHGTSERVLRNLIVLEGFLYSHDAYISDYLHFLDNLIDSSKDVELLIRNGIISSFSSDTQEVATLVNNLRPRIRTKTYFYHGIEEDINAYCKVRRHKWRATLRRDYCSSPWIIASTIAAIVLLLLTLTQTVFSVMAA